MATKTKLEQAIEKQAAQLDDAQRELVMSQFSTYKWNKNRMTTIENMLKVIDMRPATDPKEFKMQMARRKALTVERNQLTTANNSISSKLFMQLKNTGDNTDDFDDFLKGGKE